jgi:hypothetical protein
MDDFSCHKAETEADLESLLFAPAVLDGDRCLARIKFTDGPDIWDRPRYRRQLAILVEFADGTRSCRIVDVPDGMGKEAIAIQFQ